MLNPNHKIVRITITYYFMLTLLHPEVSIVCVIIAITCKVSPFYKKNASICSVINNNNNRVHRSF